MLTKLLKIDFAHDKEEFAVDIRDSAIQVGTCFIILCNFIFYLSNILMMLLAKSYLQFGAHKFQQMHMSVFITFLGLGGQYF